MFKSLRKKLFKRTLKTNNLVRKELHVLAINPDAETWTEALGISKKRQTELRDLVKKNLENSQYFIPCLEEISKSVLHANELVYCTALICDLKTSITIPIIINS